MGCDSALKTTWNFQLMQFLMCSGANYLKFILTVLRIYFLAQFKDWYFCLKSVHNLALTFFKDHLFCIYFCGIPLFPVVPFLCSSFVKWFYLDMDLLSCPLLLYQLRWRKPTLLTFRRDCKLELFWKGWLNSSFWPKAVQLMVSYCKGHWSLLLILLRYFCFIYCLFCFLFKFVIYLMAQLFWEKEGLTMFKYLFVSVNQEYL